MMRSAVDLPQPEGPSRLMNSPLPTSSDMSFRASVPLENVFEIERSDTSGFGPAGVPGDAAPGGVERWVSAKRVDPSRSGSQRAQPVAGRARVPVIDPATSAYFTSSLPTPLQTNCVV